MKMRDENRPVEMQEIYYRSPNSRDFGGNKQVAVISGRRRSRFDCSFRTEIGNRSRQSQTPDGQRGIAWNGDGNIGKNRSHTEGNPVPKPEDLHHPGIGPPKTPRLPNEFPDNPL